MAYEEKEERSGKPKKVSRRAQRQAKRQGERALRKAVKKAKRDTRRRNLDRDAEQIFYNNFREKEGTKGILRGLENYGKTARKKAQNQ